jgi:ribonuclease Z
MFLVLHHLQEIIEMQLKVADTAMCYPLHFHTIKENGVLVDNEKIKSQLLSY